MKRRKPDKKSILLVEMYLLLLWLNRKKNYKRLIWCFPDSSNHVFQILSSIINQLWIPCSVEIISECGKMDEKHKRIFFGQASVFRDANVKMINTTAIIWMKAKHEFQFSKFGGNFFFYQFCSKAASAYPLVALLVSANEVFIEGQLYTSRLFDFKLNFLFRTFLFMTHANFTFS